MLQTDTKQQNNQVEAFSLFAEVFPYASGYYVALLYHYGNFETQTALKTAADEIKTALDIPADLNADELVIKVLLMQVSRDAAKRHVAVLKSQKAIDDICLSLGLDDEYRTLLINHYGSIASESLFIDEYESNCDLPADSSKMPSSSEFPKIIDTLIDKAQKKESRAAHLWQDNHDYLYGLSKERIISQGLYYDLRITYGKQGAVNFETQYEKIVQKLSANSSDDALIKVLAAKVMLYNITEDDASKIIKLSEVLHYPILSADLQVIALKYLPLKTFEEVSQTLEALLKRLPYSDTPAENLGLAVNVMTAASPEAYQQAEEEAKARQEKMSFMKKLSTNRFFNGYEDQLTTQFYPTNTFEEVTAFFNRILKELPHNTLPAENADIAMKILLKKLPAKDGLMQASFRKENKTQKSVDALEQEALGLYLGTKSKDDVLSFFREKLSNFTFWKDDQAKHCFALSVMVEELNGKITTGNANLALHLLQAGYPEESVELISKSVPSTPAPTAQEIISNYERFYKSSSDHKDAAQRVVNMMQ